MLSSYPACFYKEKDGGFSVIFPDLHHLITCGDNQQEAFVNIVSVDVEVYAKEHFTKVVKKTLTIPKILNDMAVKQDINFSQLLQETLIKKRHLTGKF